MRRKFEEECKKPIHFTMDDYTLELLDGFCKKLDMERSPTIRWIIREYAKEHPRGDE